MNLRLEQYQHLQLEARRKAKSLSAVIRETIDKQLGKTPAQKGDASVLLAMAKKAGRSGLKKLAQDYKRYLYGDKSKYAK
ncbi:hypothetical protein HYU92_00675 [Candidatus Curtissbacteria bacterium]|nr:hypothetical protein [Candidatus Curtissbacteria bacterium]